MANPQTQHRVNFMAAFRNYQTAGLQPYHQTEPGYRTIQATKCINTLADHMKEMTTESKIIILGMLTDPDTKAEGVVKTEGYMAYWLLPALGGDKTSPREKKQLLADLNAEANELLGNPVREYVDREDIELAIRLTKETDKPRLVG